jgi:hypothetical protein
VPAVFFAPVGTRSLEGEWVSYLDEGYKLVSGVDSKTEVKPRVCADCATDVRAEYFLRKMINFVEESRLDWYTKAELKLRLLGKIGLKFSFARRCTKKLLNTEILI